MGTQLVGGHDESALCCTTTTDGRIISGGEDGELCMWSIDGELIKKAKVQSGDDVNSVCCAHTKPHTLYVAAGEDIFHYDLRDLSQPVERLSCNSDDEINHIAVNEKDEYLALCDDAGRVRVYSMSERRVCKTLVRGGHSNIVSAVSFRPRRPWDLVSGGYDKQLIQWDFSRGRSVCKINMDEIGATHDDTGAYVVSPPFIHSLAVSASGKYLACGTENAVVQIFDTSKRTPEFRDSLFGHTQGVSQVHFPVWSDSLLVSGGNDGQCFVWNLDHLGAPPLTNGHGPPTENGAQVQNAAANVPEAGADAQNAGADVQQNGVQGQQVPGGGANGAPEPVDGGLGDAGPVPQKLRIEHGEKVNWICSGSGAGGNGRYIVVADNTPELTVYTLPQL